jgi:ribosomal protein uL22
MSSKYGLQPNGQDLDAITAKARVDGVDASYRDLCNVCSNIRGRRADKAIEFLTEAFEMERPIRYPRHNKTRGHLRELGGKKGGYPVKSVKIVLDVLKNAYANAQAKGLGDCKIIHVAANKQEVYSRLSAKGRRMRQDFETAFVEIVVRELQTPENMAKKEQIKKAVEAKKQAEEAKKKAAEAKKETESKSTSSDATKAKTNADAKTETKTAANVVAKAGEAKANVVANAGDVKNNVVAKAGEAKANAANADTKANAIAKAGEAKNNVDAAAKANAANASSDVSSKRQKMSDVLKKTKEVKSK